MTTHAVPPLLAAAVVSILAVVVVVLGAFIAAQPVDGPAPTPTRGGQLGAACNTPGEYAVARDGRLLACTTTVADRTPRWRTGQLDLPTR